jgi:hypothetical protein
LVCRVAELADRSQDTSVEDEGVQAPSFGFGEVDCFFGVGERGDVALEMVIPVATELLEGFCFFCGRAGDADDDGVGFKERFGYSVADAAGDSGANISDRVCKRSSLVN